MHTDKSSHRHLCLEIDISWVVASILVLLENAVAALNDFDMSNLTASEVTEVIEAEQRL